MISGEVEDGELVVATRVVIVGSLSSLAIEETEYEERR